MSLPLDFWTFASHISENILSARLKINTENLKKVVWKHWLSDQLKCFLVPVIFCVLESLAGLCSVAVLPAELPVPSIWGRPHAEHHELPAGEDADLHSRTTTHKFVCLTRQFRNISGFLDKKKKSLRSQVFESMLQKLVFCFHSKEHFTNFNQLCNFKDNPSIQ